MRIPLAISSIAFIVLHGTDNICSVVYIARSGKDALISGDVTADLPAQDVSEPGKPGKSSVRVLVRSIPRVHNDANQYCLLSSEATSLQQWDVYGWVIAPNAGETLPLQRQVLDYKEESDPRSLRGLAAALWFFAERMSGQPPR